MVLGGEVDAGTIASLISFPSFSSFRHSPEPLATYSPLFQYIIKYTHQTHSHTQPPPASTNPFSSSVWDSKPTSPSTTTINWVELKTSQDINSDRDLANYERKLLKFWIQSFLLGVPKIIVGFRTADGILRRVEEMETATIPGTVKRRGRGSWDGNMCINFADALLGCEFLLSPCACLEHFGMAHSSFTYLIFTQEHAGISVSPTLHSLSFSRSLPIT